MDHPEPAGAAGEANPSPLIVPADKHLAIDQPITVGPARRGKGYDPFLAAPDDVTSARAEDAKAKPRTWTVRRFVRDVERAIRETEMDFAALRAPDRASWQTMTRLAQFQNRWANMVRVAGWLDLAAVLALADEWVNVRPQKPRQPRRPIRIVAERRRLIGCWPRSMPWPWMPGRTR